MAPYLTDCYESLQNFTIEKFCKEKFGKTYGEFAKEHPVINKVVIVANHAFRLVSMIALMQVLPFSTAVNCTLMIAGSLFYRVTIERLCPLKFALLSCAGSLAFEFAKLNAFSFGGGVPLAAYAFVVIYSACSYKSCCGG